MQYIGYEKSLQCVRVALTQLGPFDGLVGFSQVCWLRTVYALKTRVMSWLALRAIVGVMWALLGSGSCHIAGAWSAYVDSNGFWECGLFAVA